MKPLVGVVPLYDENKESLWMVPGYMDALTQAGALPVMMPLTDDADTLDELVSLCDGFLFTGGHDINPLMYNENPKATCGTPCAARDAMEKALFTRAVKADKALLGICRGIQMFNVLQGGTLYQDLPSEGHADVEHHMSLPYDRAVHTVTLREGTPLYELLGEDTIGVNSYHHQAIKVLGDHLEVMAVAPDDIIEAVRLTTCSFAWAVQWHPEFFYQKDAHSLKIMQAFAEACGPVR